MSAAPGAPAGGPSGGAAAGAGSGRGRARRGVGIWLVVVAAVVAVAGLGGRPRSGGPDFGPRSTSPRGAKALALLLAQLGSQIDETPTPPQPGSGGIVLVLVDQLDEAARGRLTDWVRAGGTLVAADPRLAVEFAAPVRLPGAGGLAAAASPLPAGCQSPAVAGVDTIDPAGGLALRPAPGATGCLAIPGGGNFLVIQALGFGELVLLGGAEVWTNAHLGRLDNSVLAANILAPGNVGAPAHGTVLRWIIPARAGAGNRSLLSLTPSRVKEGLVQLLVAVGVLALWRGRRIGRPVTEEQAVELPGSELVVAVGNLLHQGARLDDAAGILRSSLRRRIVDQLGVPPSASPDVMADVVAARTGLDRDMILAAVAGPPPADETALVNLARHADTIRREMGRQEMADVH